MSAKLHSFSGINNFSPLKVINNLSFWKTFGIIKFCKHLINNYFTFQNGKLL